MSRDNDKSLVYEAEFAVRDLTERGGTIEVHGNRMTAPIERRFSNISTVQDYVNKVLALNWVKAAWPNAGPIEVVYRKGDKFATYGGGRIKINDSREGMWALREIVVLHEMAHHFARGDAHGVKFRQAFLTLIEEIIGAEIAWLLRIEYAERGLSVTAPKVEIDA